MPYKTILAATDFSGSCNKAIDKAVRLAQADGAILHVIHAVEFIPPVDTTFGAISPFEVDLTEQLVEASRTRLASLCETHGIPEQQRHVEVGSPKLEIIRMAEEIGADLIVVGSHGRHGLGLLLGSTAASVVNHAACDVLSVRLQED